MSAFKKNAITFGITFCISVLVFGIVAFIIMQMFFGTDSKKETAETTSDTNVEVGFKDKIDGKSFSFLLVGTDKRSGMPADAEITADQLLVVNFCCESKNLIYIPIPSNTIVELNGYDVQIGELYDKNNMELLVQKVQGLVGFNINYYAAASIVMFQRTLGELGPIPIEVQTNMEYSDPEQDLEISFVKGETIMDAEDTVKYLRYRTDSFTDRMTRNTEYLKSLIKYYTVVSYRPKAQETFNVLLEYIITNFEEKELLKYIDTIYKYSQFKEVIYEYPGTFDNQTAPTTFTPDNTAALKAIKDYLN